MPRAKLVYLLTALLSWIPNAIAQAPQPDPRHIDASAFGERIDISDNWLFSPNDNSAFAGPAFDDSSWPAISTTRGLDTYGYHRYDIGWFRLHVELPAKAHNVVLVMGSTIGQYQAFANGVQIAGSAHIYVDSKQFDAVNVNYRIPESALKKSPGDLVIALRVARNRPLGSLKNFNPLRPTGIFLTSADAAPIDASYRATHKVAAAVVQASLALLVSLVSFALYLAVRSHPEYLLATVNLFLTFLSEAFHVALNTLPASPLENSLQYLTIGFGYVTFLEFVRLVLLLKRSRLFIATEILIFAGVASGLVRYITSSPLAIHYLIMAYYLALALNDLLLFVLLTPAWRHRDPDALILLPVMGVSLFGDCWHICQFMLRNLGAPLNFPDPPAFRVFSYFFTFDDIGVLFTICGLLLFLVLRTVRIARERERATAELQSAQTMQRLLLARSSEPTPGFNIESVYLPANEVGGDFFLVSPDPHNGSLTAILGDVSGKGLTAAMRVAIILGVLRREDARDPATILLRLNQALLSQGDIGFTTACCVRLQSDGAFTLANAGHISPYVDGQELETPPALPLGIAADQEYPELAGQLGAGARMVLMSDGVVEARSKTGELYGFERLNALTLKPAREIAATAQAFGQDDDITVLTLACRG